MSPGTETGKVSPPVRKPGGGGAKEGEYSDEMQTMRNVPVWFSVITENSPMKAARLHAEPVSVFSALGDDFQK
jgi:hypothetical protein